MDQRYSTQLFSPAHPVNQPKRIPPTRYCCRDAYSKKDYILCATCPKRSRRQRPDDNYDEKHLVPVNQQPQPEITHKLSDDYEGPLWQ